MSKTEQSAEKTRTFEIVKATLKYYIPVAWKTKKSYFLLWALRAVGTILQPFISIILTPLIIDQLLGNRDVKLLITYTAILVLGETLLSLTTTFAFINIEKHDDFFSNYFDMELSKLAMSIDFQLTEDKEALDQMTKAKEGMSWYSGGIGGIIMEFFGIVTNVIKIIGVAVLMVLNAPLLFIIVAIPLVASSIINSKNNKIEIESYTNLSKLNRVFGYALYEICDFKYGKDIRLYGSEKMMLDKSSEQVDKMKNVWRNRANKSLPLNLGTVLTDVVRDFGSYLYLGISVITGKITIGVFSQLLSAGATFNSSVGGLILSVQNLIKKSNYAYEFVKFMNYPNAIQHGNQHLKDTAHTIEFKNVSFSYPKTTVKVLDNVSIKIKPGEHLSVVGLNGAGKTTFIKLLCRLYDVDKGEILLDGVNIKNYEYDEYMKIFAIVFQDFKLLAFSAKENIMLNSKESDENINNLLKLVGLEETISQLPNKIDTAIFKNFDKDGVELSGGQQQKLAIARALYKNSPVVILDEPTAALDPIAEYEIYRQFESLVGGKMAVYISHRLSSCKFCETIAVFSEGTIKELGTHDELVLLQDGIYAEMFEAQAQYYK